MDKKRVYGLARLYLHDGIPPCINVIVRDAKIDWNNKIMLAHFPKHNWAMYREDKLPNPDEIVYTEQEEIELDEFIVYGHRLLAGFSDRLYTLVVAIIR